MTTMQNLIGRDVSTALQAIIVQEGKTKDGNSYTYLECIWKNGWKQRIYLNNDQQFGFLNAIDTVKNPSVKTATEGDSSVNSVSDDNKEGFPF